MIEVGRICVKTAGREAGKFCVIVDVLDDGMVLVTGPKAVTKVKRRMASIHHVEPTPETIKIKKNATDDEVIAAYKQGGLFKKLGVGEPTAKDVEKAKDAERKRATANKTKPKEAEEKPKEEEPKAEKKEEHKKAEPHKEKKGHKPAKKAASAKKAKPKKK